MAERHADTEHQDMIEIAGGPFRMGSERFYPEERPVHTVEVRPLRVARHPVTNAEFALFVEQTDYVTVAERPLDPEDYPGADPDLLVPGSAVFVGSDRPVPLNDATLWWAYVPGASWRTPLGPGSDLHGLDDHPVVQVAYEDALAYAAWRGLRLPTEAEWEHAARGGLDGADFVWGDEPTPAGEHVANTWQGEFPWQNLTLDGFKGTSPVGSFPPNEFGLHDMAGNVWEWTTEPWRDQHRASGACCAPDVGPLPGERFERKVIKGGSHLCAPNYCFRYRPAARQSETVDTATCHLGFRCVAEI